MRNTFSKTFLLSLILGLNFSSAAIAKTDTKLESAPTEKRELTEEEKKAQAKLMEQYFLHKVSFNCIAISSNKEDSAKCVEDTLKGIQTEQVINRLKIFENEKQVFNGIAIELKQMILDLENKDSVEESITKFKNKFHSLPKSTMDLALPFLANEIYLRLIKTDTLVELEKEIIKATLNGKKTSPEIEELVKKTSSPQATARSIQFYQKLAGITQFLKDELISMENKTSTNIYDLNGLDMTLNQLVGISHMISTFEQRKFLYFFMNQSLKFNLKEFPQDIRVMELQTLWDKHFKNNNGVVLNEEIIYYPGFHKYLNERVSKFNKIEELKKPIIIK